MDKTEGIGYSVSTLSVLITAIQQEQAFKIAQLVIACLVGVATLIYTSIKIYKEIHADGIVTEQEKKHLFKHILTGLKNIWHKIFTFKHKGDNENGKDNNRDSSQS